MGILPVASCDREGEAAVDLGETIPPVQDAVPPAEKVVVRVDDSVFVAVGFRIVNEVCQLVIDSTKFLRGATRHFRIVDHAVVTIKVKSLQKEVEFVDEFVSIEIGEIGPELGAFRRMAGAESSVVVNIELGDQCLELIEPSIEGRGEPANIASHVERVAVSGVQLALVFSVSRSEGADDQDVLPNHDSVRADHRVLDSLVKTDVHRKGSTHVSIDAFAIDPNRGLVW